MIYDMQINHNPLTWVFLLSTTTTTPFVLSLPLKERSTGGTEEPKEWLGKYE